MIVSREYIRKHKIKPARELIISGGKNNKQILSIIPKTDVKGQADDVDIFGEHVSIQNKGELELLPLNDPRIFKPVKREFLIEDTSKKNSKKYDFVFDSSEEESEESESEDDIGRVSKNATRDDLQMDHLLVLGSSGSGKTYYTTRFCKNYKKIFPKNNIILVSPLCDNKDLLKMNPVRINCGDPEKGLYNFVDEDTRITLDECKNSLIIFDDIESTIKDNKQIGPGLKKFVSDVKSLGRHYGITSITILHNPVMGRDQWLVNNSSDLVIFPGGSNYQRVLSNLGITGKTYNEIMSLPSRYVLIHKNYPRFYASDKEIKILNC